ncbi:MAG: metalloregulator ArsR/SmtB family transcription factor [Treponemataceae bacterium]|nr:metalloregulator ArsR/SmtB family transcription factor [Treponemataceae bacterium]
MQDNQPSQTEISEDMLIDLSEFFKVFGDSTRIQLLYALMDGEKCVNELAEQINATQSAVSHQLRILKNARLVKFRREGKAMLYELCDGHIRSILDTGMEHLSE